MIDETTRKTYIRKAETELRENILPFWIKHTVDRGTRRLLRRNFQHAGRGQRRRRAARCSLRASCGRTPPPTSAIARRNTWRWRGGPTTTF